MPARSWGARAVLLGLMVVAGCSSPQSATTTPSVTFGSAATTPGMPGMSGMAPMPNMPAGTAGATAGPAAPVAGNAVSIDNFAFAPATLTVHAGSTVTWTNKDEEPHTVVANDGSFHSPGMGSRATYSFTFAKGRHFRLYLLDPSVHEGNGGGHTMTDATPRDDRRQLIRHSAWFGAAVGLAVVGGEVISHVAGTATPAAASRPTLRFAQLSDSHIGFLGNANPNVADSFNQAIGEVNSLGYPRFRHPHGRSHPPGHTGAVRSGRADDDRAATPHVFTVPGEHDSIDDAGQKYRSVFGEGTRGDGWYSFDIAGVHVIALVNTLNLKKLGHLGQDQLDFVAKMWRDCPATPDHRVQPHSAIRDVSQWGWGTEDAAQALSYLRRFSSVTCLNGHVHQVFSKTEGNMTFYSGTTTAYPLPKPGDGPAPKPVTLPAGKLHDALGIREVTYTRGQSTLALKEKMLQ